MSANVTSSTLPPPGRRLLVRAEPAGAGRPDAAGTRRVRPAAGEAARPTRSAWPTWSGAGAEAARSRWTEDGRTASPRSGRADHDPPIRVHPDGLGLDARLLLHGEVHDP